MNIGANAKREVDSKFTIQRFAHKWYDLYMNALENKKNSVNKVMLENKK